MSAIKSDMTQGRGFTLVELLVVIAIIGTLIAMLVGGLGPAIGMAQNVECQSNLNQIAKAVINYATDYRGAIPPVRYTGSAGLYWCNFLVQGNYLTADNSSKLPNTTASARNSVLRCPAESGEVLTGTAVSVQYPNATEAQGIARLGNSDTKADCSYYWNGYTGNDSNGNPDAWTVRFPSVVVNPASAPDIKAQVIHDISEIKQRTQTAMVMDGILFDARAPGNRGRIAARHSGGLGEHSSTNVAFYDGHVGQIERMPGDDLLYQKDTIQSANNLDGVLGTGDTPVRFLLPLR